MLFRVYSWRRTVRIYLAVRHDFWFWVDAQICRRCRHRLFGCFCDLIFDILNSFLTFIGWARKQKDAEFYALSCGTVGGKQLEFIFLCGTIFGFGSAPKFVGTVWSAGFRDLIFDLLNSFLTFRGWARKQKDAEFCALSCCKNAGQRFASLEHWDSVFLNFFGGFLSAGLSAPTNEHWISRARKKSWCSHSL